MNFYFNTGRASRASQNNQDTAFFQAGEASKTSIFDNQQPSQTQYAYELFNQESKEPNNKQKSIISKLDQFNRETDFEELPNIVQQNQNQSSDQNESRMTFGMKMSNKLYESNVGQSKPKTFKSLLEKQPSGMKNEQVNNIVKINKDYSSNFSLKIDSFEKTPVQIQSVPLEIKGTRNKPLQTSQSLSSSSFDLQEYKSRKLLKKDKGNDVQLQQNSNIDSEAKILAEPNNRQSLKIQKKIFPSLNSNTLSTEKRQVFNLRKSKVEQNSKEKPLKYCFNKDSNFSSTSNRPQNPPITTPQKVIEPQKQKPQESKVEPKKSFLEIQKQNLRKSGVKQPSSKFNLSNFKIKQSNSEILKLPNQNSQKELIQSPPNNKHTQMQKITLIEDKRQILKSQIIEKQKKQALGLKQQLKKLGSRPTEKIQLKSIAYNPTFKFKNKLQIKQTQPQIKPQAIKQPSQYSNNRQAQRIVQDLPKSNKFISTFRDDKTQSQPHSKSHRSSQFSRAMLALMQVQQQSQIVRQKVVHSRNTYRQLAIMNDDISKRIDQVLRRATKK